MEKIKITLLTNNRVSSLKTKEKWKMQMINSFGNLSHSNYYYFLIINFNILLKEDYSINIR